MKIHHGFDMDECARGNPSLYGVLYEWIAIDWFSPPMMVHERTVSEGGYRSAAAPTFAGRVAEAGALLDRQERLGRMLLAERFVEHLQVRAVRGGWREFVELVDGCRKDGSFDWRFSGLKVLSKRWLERHRGSRDAFRAHVRAENPKIGELLYESVGLLNEPLMLARSHGPSGTQLAQAVPPFALDAARWYASYAATDFNDALEWQLAAEPALALEQNPFFALIRCYALGFYPFAVRADERVLFSFVSVPALG